MCGFCWTEGAGAYRPHRPAPAVSTGHLQVISNPQQLVMFTSSSRPQIKLIGDVATGQVHPSTPHILFISTSQPASGSEARSRYTYPDRLDPVSELPCLHTLDSPYRLPSGSALAARRGVYDHPMTSSVIKCDGGGINKRVSLVVYSDQPLLASRTDGSLRGNARWE